MSNWASPYERAVRCTGGPSDGARALLAWMLESMPGSASMGIYNCLAGETPVLTRDGWQPIGDLAGSDVDLLTADGRGPGRWVTAPVRSYGAQPLRRLTVSRQGRTRVLHTTSEHRWFVTGDYGGAARREVTTDRLTPGDKLVDARPQSVASRTRPSPVGVQAGIVFGDGTRASHDCRVMLCGMKDAQLLRWFSDDQPRTTYDDGVLVTGLPRSWKGTPSLDEGTSHLYGWLAGYFAADGRVGESGTPTLYSADRDALGFVRVLALRLGIVTGEVIGRKRHGYGDEPSMLYEVRLDPRTLDSGFFLVDEHRARWNGGDRKAAPRWKVVSVEDTNRTEEVYCAEVPGTEAFVIDEWILTGNCRSVRGGSTRSTHGEGRAVDLDPDGSRGRNGYAAGRQLVARLGQHGARLGVQFIIYNREKWSAASPDGAYYGGVHPHHDHLHIELTRAAGANLTLATCRAVLGQEEDIVTPEDIERIADRVVGRIHAEGLAPQTKDDIAERVWKAKVHGKVAANRLHDADVRTGEIAEALDKHDEFVVAAHAEPEGEPVEAAPSGQETS